MFYGLLICVVFLATLAVTERLRRALLTEGWLDVPNERSSHVQPTPRGGGIVFVVVFLLAAVALHLVQPWTAHLLAVLGAMALVAFMGLLDDRFSLSPIFRLIIQGGAAVWLLSALGHPPALPVMGQIWDIGWPEYVLIWLFLIWLLNLFNFMDGIDGIAAGQGVTVLLGGALCHYVAGVAPGLAQAAVLLAAGCAAFLCLNWSPARIFMGDSGSAFLGFAIAALAVLAARAQGGLFWSWIVLMGCFVVDATVTLIRRVLRGQNPLQAHRSHAYQRASRRVGAHAPVTLAVLVINVCWLLPWALLVAAGRVEGVLATCVAYVPLVVLVCWQGAGLADNET